MNRRLIPLTVAAALLGAFAVAAPAGAQTGPFANCTEAYAAGRSNIPASDPAYAPHLDADHDGFGCDDPPPGFVAHNPTPPTAPATTMKPAPATTTVKAPTTTKPPAVKATPRFTG